MKIFREDCLAMINLRPYDKHINYTWALETDI